MSQVDRRTHEAGHAEPAVDTRFDLEVRGRAGAHLHVVHLLPPDRRFSCRGWHTVAPGDGAGSVGAVAA